MLLNKLDVEQGFWIDPAPPGVRGNFVLEFKALEQLTSMLFPVARTHEQQLLVDVLLGIDVELAPLGNGEDLVLEGGTLRQVQQGSVHTLTPLLGQ